MAAITLYRRSTANPLGWTTAQPRHLALVPG